MAATAFTDRVDEATSGISTGSSVRTNIRSAVTTCQSSLASVFTTYGLSAQDKQAVDDKLIDICRYLESAMR